MDLRNHTMNILFRKHSSKRSARPSKIYEFTFLVTSPREYVTESKSHEANLEKECLEKFPAVRSFHLPSKRYTFCSWISRLRDFALHCEGELVRISPSLLLSSPSQQNGKVCTQATVELDLDCFNLWFVLWHWNYRKTTIYFQERIVCAYAILCL